MKVDYKKRYEFQKKINLRQSEEIEYLKAQIDGLVSLCEEKDETIHSVDYLRVELNENINEIKKYKKQYQVLIKELKEIRKVTNQAIFGNGWKWKLVRFLIK